MATLEDISKMVDAQSRLRWKFRGGVIKLASYILQTELESVTNHANRVLWAKDVLYNGNVNQRTSEMYLLGMTNDTIVSNGDNALDSDVEWVIDHFLNSVATGV